MKYDELSIDERRSNIIEILNKDSKVRVNELSERFAISEVTIRNDLDELERQGLLERVHGGAVSTYRTYYNMTFYERAKTNETEKKRIAQEAAKLVCSGDTIMINSGTTSLYVLNFIRDLKNVIIVTNSIAIAQEADRYRNLDIILLGGNINTAYQFTYGEDTISQMKKYRVDKLFLTCDGITAAEGISTGFASEAEVDRQMILRSNNIVLVTDYTKVGRVGFANIASIEDIDYLITNENANKLELLEISRSNVQIITV